MTSELFGPRAGVAKTPCAFVGMVHLAPLPGSPGWGGSLQAVREAALADAHKLIAGGCDALLVENMADVPYLRGAVPPETVAAMAVCLADVVALGLPTGVQVLAAANKEALGCAVAAGAHFIRAEAFAYAHVADEGWIDASAGPLLRTRAALQSDVVVWADVQKKHAAHAVTGDLSLADLARGTVFCGADVLVVSGRETGQPTRPEHLSEARRGGRPVVVGSGVTADTVAALAGLADAVIVGTALKEGGDWRAPVCVHRVKDVRQALDAARG